MNINFRTSTSVKPALAGTRGASKLQFFCLDTGELEEIDDPTNPGGGDDDEYIDPNA